MTGSLKKEILQKAVMILRQITNETDGWVSITENGWHISTSLPGFVDASIWLMEDKWEEYGYVPLGFPIRLKDVADFLRMTIKKGETISLRVDADKREFLITHALDSVFTRGFRWSEDDAEELRLTHGMGTVQEALTYESKFAVNIRELKKSLKLKDIDRIVLAVRGDVCFFLLLSGTELVAKVKAEIDTVRAPTELRHSSYSFIRAFKYLPDTVTMKFNHLGNVVIDSMVDGFLSVVVIADALDPETSAEIEDLLRKEIAPEVKIVKVEEIIPEPPKPPKEIPALAEQLEMRRIRVLQEEVCGDLPIHEKDRCKGAMVLYAKDLISKEEFEQTLDELSAKDKFMEAVKRLGRVSRMVISPTPELCSKFRDLLTLAEAYRKELLDLDVTLGHKMSRIEGEIREIIRSLGVPAIPPLGVHRVDMGDVDKSISDLEFMLHECEMGRPLVRTDAKDKFIEAVRKLEGRTAMPETMRLWINVVDETSQKHDERVYDVKAGTGWEAIQKLLRAIEGYVEMNYEVVHPVGEFFKSPLEFDGRMMETLTAYRTASGNPVDTDVEMPEILRWCPDPNFVAMVKHWIQKKGRVEAGMEEKLIARAQKYNIDLDRLFHQMSMIVDQSR